MELSCAPFLKKLTCFTIEETTEAFLQTIVVEPVILVHVSTVATETLREPSLRIYGTYPEMIRILIKSNNDIS